jgi:hypothetical protein
VHKTIEVFDLESGEHLHSIAGFGTPHEILFRPRFKHPHRGRRGIRQFG